MSEMDPLWIESEAAYSSGVVGLDPMYLHPMPSPCGTELGKVFEFQHQDVLSGMSDHMPLPIAFT